MRLREVGWQYWLVLSVILAIALWARCAHLGQNSLWTDEFFSLECSSGWGRSDLTLAGEATAAPDFVTLAHARPWTAIWSSIASDENHPPLYFVMLRAWRDLFGDSAVALRSLSVLASFIAIVLLFGIGVTMHGPGTGLWACLLMAVAGPQIEQAQDARAYMPMTAASLAAALALARIHRFGSSWFRNAMLCAAALAALLLHYMAFATIGGLIIYAVLGMSGKLRSAALISLGFALAIFCVIWGPQLISQHDHMMDATEWMLGDAGHHVRTTLYNLCTLPARFVLDLDQVDSPIACASVVAFALPLFFYRRCREFLLWWIWLMLPVGMAVLIDLTTGRSSLLLIKYTLAAAPALYVMLGLLAANIRRAGWIPAAVVAGCGLICIPSDYTAVGPDWREISRFIDHDSRPGDPVIFVDARPDAYTGNGVLSVSYYLAQQQHPVFVLDRPPTGKVLAELSSARHACVFADTYLSLSKPNLPGLAVNHVEMLSGMALAACADPPRPTLAKATVLNDRLIRPQLR